MGSPIPPWRAYQRPATNTTMSAGMNYLSDLIIRPGIEKTFGPLLLYRGQMNRGHAHRFWNGALLMMASEAETLADGLKLFNNAAYSQLCGPVRAPSKLTLSTFMTRLFDNPAVTRNIPGLTDYVRSLGLGECILTRVDRISDDPDCAPWRVYRGEKARTMWPQERGIPVSEQLFYPYMLNNTQKPDDGSALVKLVNSAVPDWLPDHIRADACQDLIVGILSGDIAPGAVHDWAAAKIRDVWKMHPCKYDHGQMAVSFNQPVAGTDGLSYNDRI